MRPESPFGIMGAIHAPVRRYCTQIFPVSHEFPRQWGRRHQGGRKMAAESRIDSTGSASSRLQQATMLVLVLLLLPALAVGAVTVSSPPWAPGAFALIAVAYVPVIILIFY